MAAPVPEIMDISGTILNCRINDKLRRKQPLPNADTISALVQNEQESPEEHQSR
jgi:hypothetical protein